MDNKLELILIEKLDELFNKIKVSPIKIITKSTRLNSGVDEEYFENIDFEEEDYDNIFKESFCGDYLSAELSFEYDCVDVNFEVEVKKSSKEMEKEFKDRFNNGIHAMIYSSLKEEGYEYIGNNPIDKDSTPYDMYIRRDLDDLVKHYNKSFSLSGFNQEIDIK